VRENRHFPTAPPEVAREAPLLYQPLQRRGSRTPEASADAMLVDAS
jgi:hypothetical protein